jgi:signal transduction histidine kinase
VFNVVIALLLSLLGIFETLQAVLSVYSTVAIAWIGALVADLVVLKPAGISPPYIEFKRAHLYDFNPVGCGATLIASAVAIGAYAGAFGAVGQAFFGFIALALAFAAAIAIAYATRGRYYIARADAHFRQLKPDTLVECSICERRYEAPDMAHCTFYDGPICSLCCALELHCHDHCKRAAAPALALGSRFEPHTLRRVGRFLGVLSMTAALLGTAFVLTYRFMDLDADTGADWINVMLRLYIATLALASMGIWWIVLSQESREQSERELIESMQHLERTRKDLVESEKLAALGGLVAGVAHEINTPVGIAVSTASYLSERTQAARAASSQGRFGAEAQQKYLGDAEESARLLLSNAQRVARLVANFRQLAVERVGEERRRFDLRECLDDTLRDLKPRLDEAGVKLRVDVPTGVVMDSYPVALAQVVANLVVNALHHAFVPGQPGSIELTAQLEDDAGVRLRCADDGRGIERALHGRVFEPFFTTRRLLGGSGLGLYIVNQLVTRQLDGTIQLDTAHDRGTAFEMRLPRVARQAIDVAGLFTRPTRADSDER